MGWPEKKIEDYFCEHIDAIDEDLTFFRRQYIVNYRKKKIGVIDILCVQGEDKRYVIVENKKGLLTARDMGQVLAYYKIFKNIDNIGSGKNKRNPKIIFICTGVDEQFKLAYEAISELGIEMEIKVIKQDGPECLSLQDYFNEDYGRLSIAM